MTGSQGIQNDHVEWLPVPRSSKVFESRLMTANVSASVFGHRSGEVRLFGLRSAGCLMAKEVVFLVA